MPALHQLLCDHTFFHEWHLRRPDVGWFSSMMMRMAFQQGVTDQVSYAGQKRTYL